MSVDWRFIGEELTKDRTMRDALLFKPKSIAGYRVLARNLTFLGKSKLAEIALDAAKHVNQLEE